MTWADFVILFRTFDFIAPKMLYYFHFQSFIPAEGYSIYDSSALNLIWTVLYNKCATFIYKWKRQIQNPLDRVRWGQIILHPFSEYYISFSWQSSRYCDPRAFWANVFSIGLYLHSWLLGGYCKCIRSQFKDEEHALSTKSIAHCLPFRTFVLLN